MLLSYIIEVAFVLQDGDRLCLTTLRSLLSEIQSMVYRKHLDITTLVNKLGMGCCGHGASGLARGLGGGRGGTSVRELGHRRPWDIGVLESF